MSIWQADIYKRVKKGASRKKMTNSGFRKAISGREDECLVFSADNLAQFTRARIIIPSKSDRALAAARSTDIVILREPPLQDYQDWLRSLGLGTDHVLVYDCPSSNKTLSSLIVDDPKPVKTMINTIGKIPVYVPWFSGEMEKKAADSIHAALFGASAELTWQYNEKSLFKKRCRELCIPVVDDTLFGIEPLNDQNRFEMEKVIGEYLSRSPVVLIRGTLDNAGVSLVFKTSGDDIPSLYQRLVHEGVEKILIEPFLDIISSPNDQWIIDKEGRIHHAGKRDQICENGTHHIATLKKKESEESPQLRTIMGISLSIVQDMAKAGYTGVVGIDYIVSCSGEIFPVENNARFNGSSYVSLILENIEEKSGPVNCWKFIKVKTKPCSFQELTKTIGPFLFNGCSHGCVFPFNCSDLEKTGAFSVILKAGSERDINRLEKEMNTAGIG